MSHEHAGSEFKIVTASIGVATLAAGSGYIDAAGMVEGADRRLYEAKAGGWDTIRADARPPTGT
ncbi:PleD family two-component response regulator [Aurantimonas endophytica]|uniref:PleD family two-component response regulator n=1 Tax=Aurantimonas endophytica TaxID=1522175 RepID=A0A7W6HGQ8_9HYPH|nr:PleD family two-component response regulator [Aurantimonas endophytica]